MMTIDAQRIRFKGKAISAAHAFRGSVEGADAKPFIDALYEQWLSTGQQLSEVERWLLDRFSDEFKYTNEPPQWVENEPSWPFLNGKPMTFISQCTVGELSPGETVFLFGARQPKGKGFEVIYRVISQFEGL
jgi:hypothetical protein